MKSRFVKMVTVAVTLCLLLLPVLAQPKQQPPQKKNQKDDKQTPQKPGDEQTVLGTTEVMLPITVTDDKDRPILELQQEDFLIYEDGVLQHRIKRFEPQSERPLDIAIMMDISNSVRPKLKYEREAASNFVQTMLKKRRDKVMFGTFNDQIELRQDLTDDSELIYNAINSKALVAAGDTKLRDAIYRLCQEKLDNTRSMSSTGRRSVIIVISDGEDTASERTLNETIAMAQDKGVPVFGISTKAGGFFGVQAGQVMNAEDKEMRRLTEQTGGGLFFPGTMVELEKTFSYLRMILNNQYLIIYEPERSPDGKYRKIEVKLDKTHNKNFKDFIVRVKNGYRAVKNDSN